MEKYTTWRRLSTYSVNRPMIDNIADAINSKIPPILQFGNAPAFSVRTALVVYGADSSEVYHPLSKFTQPLFPNDIQALTIELSYKEGGDSTSARAVVIEMRFGHDSSDAYLSIALQDYNKAREKVGAIEEILLTTFAPHKNRNQVTYPNDFIPPLVFVAGFVIGLGSLMFTNPFLKFGCILLFGVAIYFVAHRFTKGYCQFESRYQKRLDLLLNCLMGAVAVFVVVMAVNWL